METILIIIVISTFIFIYCMLKHLEKVDNEYNLIDLENDDE